METSRCHASLDAVSCNGSWRRVNLQRDLSIPPKPETSNARSQHLKRSELGLGAQAGLRRGSPGFEAGRLFGFRSSEGLDSWQRFGSRVLGLRTSGPQFPGGL